MANDHDIDQETVTSEPGDIDVGASADGENGDAPSTPEPSAEQSQVLNQDEIESLLGLDAAGEDGFAASGIDAIVNTPLIPYERLPMLEVIFDRLVKLMSKSLRNFTSDNVEISLDSIESARFGEYLNGLPLPAMLNVVRVDEWDNYALVSVDSQLVYSVVDVLLGGCRGTAAMRIEGRPFTSIERSLVERMVHVMLGDLGVAFEPLSPVTFRFDRLETNPRFATITRPANAAIVARLRVDMEDRGGCLDLVLPYATLEPVRELLLQMFMGEKFGRDSIWESHLSRELWQAGIELTAIMDERTVPLKDVFDLKVGSRIMFSVTPESPIEMRTGGIPMYLGRMGRQGDRIAIQIDKRLDRQRSKE